MARNPVAKIRFGVDKVVRIVMMLLHDERFSGWTIEEKLSRFHFSKQFLKYCKSFGWEPILYTFHEGLREKQTHEFSFGTVKILPVKFRFPPLLKFGNDHNPAQILKELESDEPDIVHFHNYYLYSFPYLSQAITRKVKRPFTAQSHSYVHGWRRRLPYAASVFQLRKADKIFYSYKPEKAVYRRLGLLHKAKRIPVPSVDPSIFRDTGKRGGEGLLYIGRLPDRWNAYAEKSPLILFLIMQKLQRLRDVKLSVVGDGPGLPHYKNLVQAMGIQDSVEFKGFVPHNQLQDIYSKAALTLVPLELEEIDGFFDGSIQESLACGTPVAAFRSSDVRPLKSTFGYLLSKQPETAAKQLSALLEDPDALNELGVKGSAFVHGNCTEEVLRETLRSEWEGLMKK